MNLTIFNGSPRGSQSNTAILLEHFLGGFSRTAGNSSQVFLLVKRTRFAEYAEAFAKSQTVLLAMPLYVHAMPGLVKHFIETLPALDPARGVALGFLVQSGFPEAHHSRYLEAYLDRLPARLGCRSLGTVIKGGVEGIQIQPPWMTRKLFGRFYELGERFGRLGAFDPHLVAQLARPEWLDWKARLAYRLLRLTGLADFYWDRNLKKNKAYDRRFDRPYAP